MLTTLKLLICSYDFGPVSPEGICTERLVQAFLAEGCKVALATSTSAKIRFQHQNFLPVTLPTWPGRPHRLWTLLARIGGQIQLPGPHYAWILRMRALHLQETPDLIYGRALPFSSAAAARALARRIAVPWLIHFSDPVPDAWLEQDSVEFRHLQPGVRRVTEESSAVSFPTAEGLSHQEQILSLELKSKSFVLNHIAPPPRLLPTRPPGRAKVFGYFGAFYGKRTATALLEGFAQHLRSHPEARLLCVGSNPASVLPDARRLGIQAAVAVHERVDDIYPVMATVDVLVSLDAMTGPAIFMPTKMVEYFVVNRPILLISPATSPGAALSERFQRTVVHVWETAPDVIAEGFRKAGEVKAGGAEYADRFAGMEPFSSKAVARYFLAEVERRQITGTTR